MSKVAFALSLCSKCLSRSQAICLHIFTNHSQFFSLTPIFATSASALAHRCASTHRSKNASLMLRDAIIGCFLALQNQHPFGTHRCRLPEKGWEPGFAGRRADGCCVWNCVPVPARCGSGSPCRAATPANGPRDPGGCRRIGAVSHLSGSDPDRPPGRSGGRAARPTSGQSRNGWKQPAAAREWIRRPPRHTKPAAGTDRHALTQLRGFGGF